MAGYGSVRPEDTASNPARAGLPGIQPGEATAGIGGFGINTLSDAFQKGLQGPDLGDIAKVASFVPGPIGVAGKIATVAGVGD